MKKKYYSLFLFLFLSFIVNAQTPIGSDPNQPIDVGPGLPPIEVGPGSGGSGPQSTNLNDLLYSEIFNPKIGTPNAAAFRKVSFSNVSEYTGSASINVPIYQIQIGQISIPIELNYSATGIKVEETASNVGQNWSLNAGGMVTKVIKGIEDFKVTIEGALPYVPNSDNHKLKFSQIGTSDILGMKLKEVGWLMQNESISLNKYFDVTSATDKVYSIAEMGFITNKKDLAPDQFYVNAPGLNTSFTHKRDRSVMEIAFQGNKIETTIGQTAVIPFFSEFRDNYKFTGDLRYFDGGPHRKIQGVTKVEVTNINGTQYTFDQLDVNQYVNRNIFQTYINMESSRDLTSQEIMAYKLSKIKDFKGNEVTFEYNKYAISYPEYRKTANYELNNLQGDQSTLNLSSTEIRYPLLNRISKIIYAEGTVEFKYEEPRQDLPGDFALSKIIVKDIYGTIIKTVKLEYDYMTSNNNCSDPTCKRLRLLAVQETGKNDAVIPPYRFYYNDDVKLPERGSNITDYLGYANGPVSGEYNNVSAVTCLTCLIPPPKLYYSPNKKDFSVSPFPIFDGSFVTAGRSLQPSLAYTKAGVLNKVKYPTGGTEEFEYELNSFYSSLGNKNVNSGGLRVSIHKLIDNKGTVQVHKYNYLNINNNSSGILNNLPTLGIAQAYNEPLAATYLGISSYSLQTGLTLHTFSNSRSDFDVIEGSNVGYTRVLIKENADNGYVEKIFSTREDFPVERPLFTYQNYDKNKIEFGFNNGWRLPTTNNTEPLVGKIKYTRKYDKANNLVEETKNSYQYDIFDQISDKVEIARTEVFPAEAGDLESIDPDFAFYPSVYASRNLTSETKTTTKYNQNKVINTTSTTYDQTYSLPKAVESIVEESGSINSLIKQTSYPHNYATPLMVNLVNANRIAEPVLQKTIRKTDQTPEDLTSQEVLYDTFTKGSKTLILPRAVQAIKGIQTTSNQFEEKIQFHDYDKFGNPIESSKKDDTHTVYLWGYNYTKPIAKIENATYSQVMNALGKSNSETLEYIQNYSDNSLNTEIQKIRSNLGSAMVTSYVYKPLVGITSVVDPKGTSISYEYDDLNRLKRIKDQDQNIIEEYCYGYNGVLNDCQNQSIIPSPEDQNTVTDLDLQIKIGDYKAYKVPVACGRGVNWEDKLPDGAEYKGRNILSLHDKLYFPNPSQIGVHYTPDYIPLPLEYSMLNLPYPTSEYTCNYYAERSGNTFDLLGLNNSKFSGPNKTAELTWWMEIDGKKIEIPKVQEYSNVFFIPKCLDGMSGRIICTVKVTSRWIDHVEDPIAPITYIAKSDLIKFKSGLNDYDNVLAYYKLSSVNQYSGNVCDKSSGYGIDDSTASTESDPKYWQDTPWTIDNGVIVDQDFKISIEKYKLYDIPVPFLQGTNFSWPGTTTPSLHPLFYFPRPFGGIHGEDFPYVPHAYDADITFPYTMDSYYGFYVTKGGYKFDRNAIKQRIGNSSEYEYQWFLKLADTGQEVPLIRTLEAKNIFFVPPALNGKRGKLICIATKMFGLTGAPLYFESENITFQQGLSNEDNLDYQVQFLDMEGL
ncbi:RHS repeat protein [Flavobacterium chilense]|uniref:YD repeat-containing protein n=1 Tax=Flavobacterium chilense TaxID=946677 RepID=A0A1M7MZY6_9FLAO|nr:RHS repeat protein [Flavobacterium chilense]SHM96821.1 YD repeat-containing protein [Flavobacterium chilense]